STRRSETIDCSGATMGSDKGCREMASDTTPENTISQKVHQALGFEETERVIFYRKRC
ncbi:Aminoglycoside 6'-N-acetyltransferase, partial [Salmonella enterica subsp. enterica serovar Heidelberg str. RI-11-013343]